MDRELEQMQGWPTTAYARRLAGGRLVCVTVQLYNAELSVSEDVLFKLDGW